jgi:hypothetical protein
MKLLTTKNYKTLKGEAFGYATAILHLAPFKLSGKNVCPKASKGCSQSCLNTAGHGRYSNVQNARKNRTLRFFNEREVFERDLIADIETQIRRARKNNLIPAIRPNGTSDLPALAIKMAKSFPEVQFYDYTKIAKTFEKELPKNYHLTFSRSENNENECFEVLKKGYNVAMVFDKLPKTYKGYKVVDGDKSDLRFLDKKGVIVGLSAKGKARHDKSGFVIRTEN